MCIYLNFIECLQFSIVFSLLISDDHLHSHNSKHFSTKDVDNDERAGSCAVNDHGGWWYYNCALVNLNGPYIAGPAINESAMFWYQWPTAHYSLKKSSMMIKRIL